ncbi:MULTISPECIES: hypothetical protein [Prolixibacter]|uniref:PH (Pleckstrin Homology) domain-containing protein n=1 Tax=Prolixibacter denitrificans TaxID=1541063 RepID=A0A2P8CIC4_9BACT|nr:MULTISPECIES: hypothetical protein [Prolixibacter]PSK84714.1 hypothetical protein CLV93_102505 [Prolixibacter denitrificans]GET20879.1 hypothetical protein JCM18694_11250 [Prolixibacter denitrificans]GET27528.1 hypothetical protein NT017_38570 [Prolixibacter sp. NT017]
MIYSNRKYADKLRKRILLGGVLVLVSLTVLLLLQLFTWLAIGAAVFVVAFLFIAALNLQYIRIFDEKEKIIIRYFSVFTINRLFQSIEFPVTNLMKAEAEKHLGGIKTDLILTVRTRQGVAVYPPVSLSGIKRKERQQIIEELNKLIPRKKEGA